VCCGTDLTVTISLLKIHKSVITPNKRIVHCSPKIKTGIKKAKMQGTGL
jgi:hypothetical protein